MQFAGGFTVSIVLHVADPPAPLVLPLYVVLESGATTALPDVFEVRYPTLEI